MKDSETSFSITHKEAEKIIKEEQTWPQYYVTGETVDEDDFVPAYYKLEGPNGPVSYMNPNSGPYPTTMYEFAMDYKSEDSRECLKEETPWVSSNTKSGENKHE